MHCNNHANLPFTQKSVPPNARGDPRIQLRPVCIAVVGAQMLPHLRSSIALVLLADELMSAPGSQGSCLHFPNVPESQATDHIQDYGNRPNGLGYTAAYDGVDELAFASQVLSIRLLVVGFQPATLTEEIQKQTKLTYSILASSARRV
jgi:hypothetical protein